MDFCPSHNPVMTLLQLQLLVVLILEACTGHLVVFPLLTTPAVGQPCGLELTGSLWYIEYLDTAWSPPSRPCWPPSVWSPSWWCRCWCHSASSSSDTPSAGHTDRSTASYPALRSYVSRARLSRSQGSHQNRKWIESRQVSRNFSSYIFLLRCLSLSNEQNPWCRVLSTAMVRSRTRENITSIISFLNWK